MSSHGGGSERWLVSYSDFITVLMALFLIMFAMSNVDIQKYKALAESLKAALGGEGGPVNVVSPGIDSGGGLSPSSENSLPAPISIPGIPVKSMTTNDVAMQLSDMVSDSKDLSGAISVQNNIEGAFISLSEKITFKEGTATLNPQAYPVLDKIIALTKPMDNQIKIVGHTDDNPPADAQYKDSWALSMGRAIAVLEYMQQKGIPGYRLIASARGKYEPLFPNDTPQHKILNNRVEIVIIYKIENDMLKLNEGLTP